MTTLRLHNTLTRAVEEFQAPKKTVGLYTCGPTVYHYAHVGNLRTFLLYDLLGRTLRYFGFRVRHVMNVTDVGHLTSDADTGEDKLAAAAARERKTAWEVAEFYTEAFLGDLRKLHIVMPTKLPRATAHIKEQIALVRELERKGFTYRTEDGLYFDTAKFPGYGKLSRQRPEEKEAGKRVAVGGKRRPTDFALWKSSPTDAKRDMEWKSPWGTGFPGWHLECSAMARKYLGQPFDIHAGGADHVAVHHENEIAQGEAAYGVPLARYWVHGEFLVTPDAEKMSKSKGTGVTLADLERQGIEPLAFRYFTYAAHYRKPLTLSMDALRAAQNALRNLRAAVRSWEKPRIGCAEFEARFAEALADDLDMPKALAVVWELVKSDYPTHAKAESLLRFDAVLGLDLKRYVGKPVKVPPAVRKLLVARAAARRGKDWKEADRLRDAIAKAGFLAEDTKEGQIVSEVRMS